MNLPSCRSGLRGWIARTILATTAAGAVAEIADAQTSRPATQVARPTAERRIDAASPEWAFATIRAGETSSAPARKQAVGILGSTFWQADAETEMVLIFALRSDPSDDVRAKAAATLGASRYITTKVFTSLQCCSSGSANDGYPSETSPSVRWQANDALRKHSRPANEQDVMAMQRATFRRKTEASRKAAAVRDGSEESSPPEKKAETSPTPSTPSIGGPIPTVVPPGIPAVKTVSIPLPPPPSSKAKGADRLATAEKAPAELPPLPVDNRSISMRERRAELREMGLADPTLAQFQKEIGAPPPKVGAATQSSGLFKGMFAGTPPAAEIKEQEPPRQAPTATPNLKSNAAGERIVEISDVSQAGAVVPAPRSTPTGGWNRIFGRPSAPQPEPIPRTVDGRPATPISTTPTLRTP